MVDARIQATDTDGGRPHRGSHQHGSSANGNRDRCQPRRGGGRNRWQPSGRLCRDEQSVHRLPERRPSPVAPAPAQRGLRRDVLLHHGPGQGVALQVVALRTAQCPTPGPGGFGGRRPDRSRPEPGGRATPYFLMGRSGHYLGRGLQPVSRLPRPSLRATLVHVPPRRVHLGEQGPSSSRCPPECSACLAVHGGGPGNTEFLRRGHRSPTRPRLRGFR